jgi:Fe(3+) dicitrate transport protein
MNMSVPIGKHVLIKAGVNNIFNVSYFTKRPQFYPEPGIWPSDGRSLYGTVALHF